MSCNGGYDGMGEIDAVTLFEKIDEMTMNIQKIVDEPYLDRLQLVLESLYFKESTESLDEYLKEELKKIDLEKISVTQIRKAIQFGILKGMKKSTQPNHSMTPESIALFIGYLADKLINHQEETRIFDPASGTGNLLLHVMGYLSQPTIGYASEIDPSLLKLSAVSANLQKQHVELFHQDSIRPLLLDPVDLVISNLPVGYYPDDERAKEFMIRAEKGHTFAHHLFIEQSMNYTKDGRYLIFIVPNNLFDSEQSEQLTSYIQKTSQIVGLLQLPNTAFANKENAKSILILQKKGEDFSPIKQPLLVMLPSFSEPKLMENIIVKINQWFKEQLGIL